MTKTILLLGQSNVFGANDAALLPGQWAGVRTHDYIWNVTAGAWQLYNAGTNSAQGLGSNPNYFGPEVSAFDSIRTAFALPSNEDVAIFKYGYGASSLMGINGLVSWSPAMAQVYTAFLAALTAALAAPVNGGTAQVAGIVWNQGESDILDQFTADTHQRALVSFMKRLRTTQLADALNSIPILIVGLHNKYVLSAPQAVNLGVIRRGQRNAERQIPNANFLSTDSFTVLPDNTHFDVSGTIALGSAIGPALLATPPVLGTAPSTVARPKVRIIVGQSNAKGAGLQTEMPQRFIENPSMEGVLIYNPAANGGDGWDTLEMGVNHIPYGSSAPGSFPFDGRVGMEMTMAEQWRIQNPTEDLHIFKLGLDGSSLAPNPPDPLDSWDPGAVGEAWDLFWQELRDAMRSLQARYDLMPEIVGITFYQGETDGFYPDLAPAYGPRLEEFYFDVNYRLTHVPADWSMVTTSFANEDGDPLKWEIVRIHQLTYQIPGSYTALPWFEGVRNRQSNFAYSDQNIALINIDDLALWQDNIHLPALSICKVGERVMNAEYGLESVPIFAPSWESLVKSLRLTGVPADQDAYQIMLDALGTTKTLFYRTLGAERLKVLQGYNRATNPITKEEHTRALAQQVEVKMMRRELLRTLKVTYTDGNAGNAIQQLWNQVGLARGMSKSDLDAELLRLNDDISSLLGALADDIDLAIEAGIRFDVPENEDPPLPGETVFTG